MARVEVESAALPVHRQVPPYPCRNSRQPSKGRPAEAHLRALLGLAAGDQLSIDRGSWTLASELLLENPANFAAYHNHPLPTGSEPPFTRLMDRRWVEVLITHLRHVESYLETRRKLAGSGGSELDGDRSTSRVRTLQTRTEMCPRDALRKRESRTRAPKNKQCTTLWIWSWPY